MRSSALLFGLRSGERESIFAIKCLSLQESAFAKPPLRIHFYEEAEPDALRALGLQFASCPRAKSTVLKMAGSSVLSFPYFPHALFALLPYFYWDQ